MLTFQEVHNGIIKLHKTITDVKRNACVYVEIIYNLVSDYCVTRNEHYSTCIIVRTSYIQ